MIKAIGTNWKPIFKSTPWRNSVMVFVPNVQKSSILELTSISVNERPFACGGGIR
jgi:hypothetical protein